MTTSFPTTLNPWFVLCDFDPVLAVTRYYTNVEDEKDGFTTDAKKAAIFTHLGSAARIAKDDDWLVVVLHSKEQLKDYGRD